MWLHNTPHDSPQNDTEVWKFAETMADPQKNADLMLKLVSGQMFSPIPRYGPKKICGNLLMANSPLLKDARGEIVPHPKLAMFGFGLEPPVAGELIVATVPVAYTMEDRALLAGIIRHELRHAADFISMGGHVKGVGATGELAALDPDAYVSHIMECRAFSDQLKWLLKLMGSSAAAVMKAIRSSPFFGMDPDFAKCAEYFLEGLTKQKNEAALPAMHQPPAMVRKAETPHGKMQFDQITQLLHQIMQKMRFANNVRVPAAIKADVH